MNPKVIKSKKNYAKLIGLVCIFLTISVMIYCNNFTVNTVKKDDSDDLKIKEVNTPKKAGYVHFEDYINISGSGPNDWAYTAATYDWCYFENYYYVIENVTIDATGHDNGILIKSSTTDYFVIRNCTIYNAFEDGIYCVSVENGTFINNSIYNSRFDGIYMRNAKNITISKCKIDNTQISHGIILINCNNITISNNTVCNSGAMGISFFHSDNNDIIDNTFTFNKIYDNGDDGLRCKMYVDAVGPVFFINNIFSHNEIYDNGKDFYDDSIDIEFVIKVASSIFCEDNTISDNDIYNNGVNEGGIGIRLDAEIYDSSELFFKNNQIVRNNISHTGMEGILVQMTLTKYTASSAKIKCELNKISENRLESIGSNGIALCGGTDVDDSNVADGGLYINNNTIENNIIKDMWGDGIALYSEEEDCDADLYFENNSIINNEITKISDAPNYQNVQAGIYLDRFSETTITNNEMIGCGLFISSDTNFTMLKSNKVKENNKVNGKLLYFEIDTEYLKPGDFVNPGQLILLNCNHTKIYQLNVSEATIGICLYYCENVSISNVNSSKGYGGFALFYSNENNISNNRVINNNWFGILLYESNGNNVTNNNFLGNRECIIEENCTDNLFLNNRCPSPSVTLLANGDDDDDDGKEQIIVGYNLLILFLFSLIAIIAIVKELTKKKKL